jgi:erythronate-4-phosphate dehydrogenase
MKLVIDDAIFNYKEIFGSFGEILALPGKEITAENVKDCDILIVRSRTKVDANLLFGSKVKFVGSAVSGRDHLDLDYLQKNNIYFADGKGSNANTVAEYVIWNILNLAKKYNFDYQDKTLGIVGVGEVGKRLAHKAKELGIQTLLNDPPRKDAENLDSFVALDYLLQNVDILSFHTPLTFNGKYPSFNLLNKDNFNFVKNQAIIINAARGGVIDEKSWLKHQGIKIVDCWQNEPNINLDLLEKAELATGHIAGHSMDAKLAGSVMVYDKLCEFLGQKPQNFALNITTHNLENVNLLKAINQIYDFRDDDKVLRAGDFENYRRNYPKRYEWRHYGIKL